MIIDDYLFYTKDFKKKYGEKTIVLMQVGSFFEIYSISDDTDSEIYKIGDICNIIISKKNKSIKEVSIHNPLMAGFPLYVITKYQNILLQNNYTIVMIEQVTEPPNPDRKVTEILSPGMNINLNTKKSNYMMVVYYEKIKNLIISGISCIDISTGKSFVYEVGSTKDDVDFANNEIFRLLLLYNPCELVILSNDTIDDNDKIYILNNLNINNNILIHYKWNSYEYIEVMEKLNYQEIILLKVYKSIKSQLDIIELLNLQFYNIGRIAFCCLLQFAYNHNTDIINDLLKPEILENNKYLNLEYDSALQLNLISINNNEKPLLEILNRCCTSFGTRLFKQRLLQPIVNIEELNKKYDDIDLLLDNELFKKVSKYLNKILDLERIKRRIVICKLNPHEWCGFNSSLENTLEICNLLSLNNEKIQVENIIRSYIDILNLDNASKYNINDIKGNIFKEGIYEDVDEYEKDYIKTYNKIKKLCETISNLDKTNDSTNCKIEYTDRDGYYLLITKKRYENARKIAPNFINNFKILLPNQQTNYKLSSNELNEYSRNIEEKLKLISELSIKYYKSFINNFIYENEILLDNIINKIANIDISCCCAKNAHEYRYYRPKIINNISGGLINAKDIRHPIIERINQNVKYIGNDIKLTNKGFLLYGINASGKSSFMKTIGLNIIMAQAGMYVASYDLEYSPYHHIFTRISGVDNIYKGMSSFTVEMTELRNILQRSDKFSLVLGDEVCNGTETLSGLSIVAAAINDLIKKSCSFIFATHLHELIDIELIKQYINEDILKIYHLHTTTTVDNRIIYDRILKKGKGSSIYGIEVCKALDMPMDFMKNAEKIRKELQGHDDFIISLNKSHYNKKLLMDLCNICGNECKDTHHIDYQCKSDENGFFKNYHKNIKHNLVPLCKECHLKEHRNEISIKGFEYTSEGIKLKVENNEIEKIDKIKQIDKIEKIEKIEQIDKINEIEKIDKIDEINDTDISTLKKYILYSNIKKSWFIRTTKTSKFKICNSNKKVLNNINKLLNINITIISEKLYNLLLDDTL